jgi:hypothetical protein
MSAVANTTSTEIQEVGTPAIAFAPAPERRGRDHTVTPLDEEDANNTPPTSEKKKQRNSLAAFAERLRSRSRSHSRHRGVPEELSMDRTATQSSTFSTRSTSSRMSSKSRSGSRARSSIDEAGPYADVARAQNEFMEKLREEQAKNGVTHNVDGLPIRSAPSSRNGSRRSSVAQILGLDKPLLAF